MYYHYGKLKLNNLSIFQRLCLFRGALSGVSMTCTHRMEIFTHDCACVHTCIHTSARSYWSHQVQSHLILNVPSPEIAATENCKWTSLFHDIIHCTCTCACSSCLDLREEHESVFLVKGLTPNRKHSMGVLCLLCSGE